MRITPQKTAYLFYFLIKDRFRAQRYYKFLILAFFLGKKTFSYKKVAQKLAYVKKKLYLSLTIKNYLNN